MSIDIIVEVMDHAPASLTPAERYALLVLAEDARLPSREIKHDITDEYLLGRLRMSARSWLNMRGELVKKKAIEKVEGGHNGKRARYRIPVFNEAMKGHPNGDSTAESAPELSTGTGDSTSPKGHPIGESRVTQSVTHTYIPRITPGGSTTPTMPADPTSASSGGGGGDIDDKETDHHAKARELLASLPPSHRPGRSGAAKLASAVAELLARSWPEHVLLDRLSGDLPAAVGSLAGLLKARLPEPVEYVAASALSAQRDSPATRPTHCGECDPRTRMIEDEDRTPRRCPTCHPKSAKSTHQPYQNPPDQSVYFGAIS